MNVYRACCLFAIVPLLLLVAGCGEPIDPRIAALQTQFMLDSETEGAQTVSSIRKELLESADPTDPPKAIDVVIRGLRTES